MFAKIAQDLAKSRAKEVVSIRDAFNKNAGWAGYFFYEGINAPLKYNAIPQPPRPYAPLEKERAGFHMTFWNEHYSSKLNLQQFLMLVTEDRPIDLRVVGYADDGTKEALLVQNADRNGKLPMYWMANQIQPTIILSYNNPHEHLRRRDEPGPDACKYMQFGPLGNPKVEETLSIPKVLKGGQPVVVMRNAGEMKLNAFREAIRAVEMDRMRELASKLPPEVVKAVTDNKDILALKPFDQMTWETLKKTFISSGIMFNEDMAQLYACYLADTTNSKMPTRSEVERKEDEEEAEYDKKTDEEWENGDDKPVIDV